ncbi:MAG: hypothetical protein F2817_16775, partial [Actinobacteria bacterium]|nr:hypothetical protein [Actinomycetota bacterium]
MTDAAPSPTVGPSRSDDPPADAVVVGLGPDGPLGLPAEAPSEALGRLVESGEARSAVGAVAHTHAPDGVRWILVGLGADPTDEDRRAAVGAAVRHARTLRASTVRVVLDDAAGAAAAAEAATLALHEPAKVVGRPAADPDPDAGTGGEAPAVRIAGPGGAVADDDATAAVDRASAVAGAQNAARVLQQLPSNHLTPRLLATRARALADELPGLEATVEVGIGALRRRGMGLFAAVSHGSDQPPALITLRWEPEGASGPLLALVGKAVTHDTGGYSLKPPLSMRTMRFDMSGGAA